MKSIEIRTERIHGCCRAHALRAPRPYRGPVTIAASILLAAVTFVSASWLLPGTVDAARAADSSKVHRVGVLRDVTVDTDETRDHVVVVGGRATILGTVRNTVVVVGGDVIIGPEARVGAGGDADPDRRVVVVVFGDITVEPGATVVGRTLDVGWRFGDWLGAVSFSPDFTKWDSRTVGGWAWFTVFLAVVAVIMAAIAPRQVAFVSERVRHHAFSSLGWGALAVFIAVPIITLIVLVLVLFLVGILLLIPWLGIVLPVTWLFGFVAVGAALGRLILGKRGDRRGPVMLAAVLGVVILSVLWWIPVAGPIILFLLSVVGFGATCVAVLGGGRRRGSGPTTAPAVPVAPSGAVPPQPPATDGTAEERSPSD